MSVTLTEKAAKEVQRVMSEQKMPETTILRLGVVGGGCSGFQYSLGFDNKIDDVKDELSEQHGIKMAVDKKFDPYLDGTEVDYIDGLEKSGFTFTNPNEVKKCGCGSYRGGP